MEKSGMFEKTGKNAKKTKTVSKPRAAAKKLDKKAKSSSIKQIVKSASKAKTSKTVKAALPKTVIKPVAKKTVKKTSPKTKTAGRQPPTNQKIPTKKIVKKTLRKETPNTMTAKKEPTKNKPSKHKAENVTEGNTVSNINTSVGIKGIIPYQTKTNEEYMNVTQRSHFEKILVAWKQSLMEEVDRIVSQMQDEAANFPDPNDRATQEEEFGLVLRARDRERKLIKKIEEALSRLKNNDYGYCEACGVEIGIRRLEARPTATLCIDCKTLDEIRERQTRGS